MFGLSRRSPRTPGLRAAVLLASSLLLAPASAEAREQAQASEPDTTARTAVSPDSADVLRAALDRPPATPPFDAVDAVTLPLRVATLPVRLLGDGIGALLALATGPGPPPGYLLALRSVSRWGLHPGFGSELGPRSGPAAQLRFDRYDPFFVETAWSLRGSQRHEAGFRLDSDEDGAGLTVGFERQAEPHFWGTGPDSREEDVADFLWDRVHATATGAARPTPWLTLSAASGVEDNRTEDGRDPDVPGVTERFGADDLFGLGERTTFAVARLRGVADATRLVGFQRRGVALALTAAVHRGVEGTAADFHTLGAVGRGHLPLDARQELFLRAEALLRRGDDGAGVPFTHLSSLGDELGGRAYADGRFRGRDLLSATAEWRWEIWRELQNRMRVEGLAFAEAGAVGRRIDEISTGDMAGSWGLGLRIIAADGYLGSGYLAFGEEGTRAQVEIGWEF